MFSFLKGALKSAYQSIKTGLSSLFGQNAWSDEASSRLEKLLLENEFGSRTTQSIMQEIKQVHREKNASEIREVLQEYLEKMLASGGTFHESPGVYFLVGINGGGKTTTAVKLGMHLKELDNSPLLIAADTFRAAAKEQLVALCGRCKLDIFSNPELHDPASVIFQGCTHAAEQGYTSIIIDTAGRLQTKSHLMQELSKMRKVADKVLPNQKKFFLLTIDVTLGQNSLDQALLFHQATPLSGLILTKFDALTKPGIVFSIVEQLKIPVAYIAHGEDPSAFSHFDPHLLIKRILDE